MDVRCENCQTVYEFDDARVKEGGVSVKCTQCGHVFKVTPRPLARPRTLTGLRPISDTAPQRSPTLAPSSVPPSPVSVPARAVREDTGSQRLWMLRSPGSTEVRRFRDLTTLQMWIVEGQAGPDDVLSRNGDRWQRIGSIGELEPFFRVVAQAAAARQAGARPDWRAATPAPDAPWRAATSAPDAPWRATEPQLEATSPLDKTPVVVPAVSTARYGLVEGPPVAAREPTGSFSTAGARPPAEPTRPAEAARPPEVARLAEAQGPAEIEGLADDPQTIGGDDDDLLADELPLRRPSGRALAVVAAVAVVAGVAGFLVLQQRRAAAQRAVASQEARRMREAWQRGRSAFLLDSDEDLATAEGELQKARAAGPGDPLPLAGLVELLSTRARSLRDDASGANPPGAIAATDAIDRAQAALLAARRYLGEVQPAGRADPYLSRAIADLLVNEGAPAAQVEQALARAEPPRRDDPEARYVRALLALRDGRASEGRALLEQANQLSRSQTQRDLLRAKYLLAMQLATTGDREAAAALARAIVEDSPRHARAARLLARLAAPPAAVAAAPAPGAPPPPVAAAVAAGPAPVAAAAPVAAVATPTAPAVPPGRATAGPAAGDKAGPRGYAALCAAGNRLLENGRGREAVKMFERALAESPHGVEAESGLGWALLDTEHYNAAADKFKQVLADMPGNGEALIGLAETYKLRGDHRHALDWYKRYVAELPRGPKAAMAQANVRELEDEAARKERPAATAIHDAPPLPVAPTAAGQ